MIWTLLFFLVLLVYHVCCPHSPLNFLDPYVKVFQTQWWTSLYPLDWLPFPSFRLTSSMLFFLVLFFFFFCIDEYCGRGKKLLTESCTITLWGPHSNSFPSLSHWLCTEQLLLEQLPLFSFSVSHPLWMSSETGLWYMKMFQDMWFEFHHLSSLFL